MMKPKTEPAPEPVLLDPRPAVLRMRGDPWGGDVHTALARSEHGGIDLAVFAVHAAGGVPEHAHAFHEVLLPLALSTGQHVGWRIDGAPRRAVGLQPGTAMLFAAGQRHAADWDQGWMRLGLKIDPQWLAAYAAQAFGARRAGLVPQATAVLDPDLSRAAHQLLLLGPTDARAETEVLMFVSRLLRRYGDGMPRSHPEARPLAGPRLRTALDALSGPSLPVAEVAAMCGLTTWQFIRAFRRATGLPPARWAARHRAHRARELLVAQPELPLPAVAAMVGYESERQLQRWCRAVFAQSPSEIRGSTW